MPRSKRRTDQLEEKRFKNKRGLIINAPYVRVRKSPNKDSLTLMVLERGDKVEIVDKLDGFYNVICKNGQDDQLGYVNAQFIEPMEDV